MSDFVVGVVVKLAEKLYEWSQTDDGQEKLGKFFAAIRKAWGL